MPKDRQPGKYEWRVPFGKEGETLNKENFSAAFLDFCKNSYAKGEPRGKDESEFHYTQRVTEPRTAAKLCADNVVDKIVGMLTYEQKMQIYQDAPDKNYFPRKVRGMFTDMLSGPRSDYQKKVDLSKIEGPDQAKYAAEVEAINAANSKLNNPNISIEQAKEAVKDLLTPEQIEKVTDPANNISSRFIIDNREYVTGKLIEMLTPEQMNELKATAETYVAPWERAPEEMGEKAYTAESEKAKADIDKIQNLSQEQKDAMKADIDAANNFLLKPLAREDPQDVYFALSTAYERAVLHDGEKAGEAMMKEQGFDYDVMKQEFNMDTMSVDPILNEAKQEEFDKWNEQEFKMSPKTKESVLKLASKMQEYGYGGKGVIKEQGQKEYGLSALAATIKNYKAAVESGDATKIAEASKAMLQEKAHVDEMLDFVRENFPIDRTSENFAKPGNIDVVRNGTFPPEYRYDEAVTTFNSVFIAMNFAEANGMTMEEFLEHPSKALRDSYYGQNALGINKGLQGKVGGAALFEASRRDERVLMTSNSYGAARAFEGFLFFDSDPEIRKYNQGLNKFLDENIIQNAELSDGRRRVGAYTKGRLDRFLYVTEPRDDASLLGIKVYDPKTFGYKQPEAFNEAEYLQNNGKSIGEMKEFLDNSIKEFYHLSKTQKVLGSNGLLYEQPSFGGNRLLELAQEAASKILMAKHAEKDDPSYQALKGILTNGKDYLLGLVMPEEERQKLVDAEKQLAQAKKDGNKAEIDRLQKYVNEHDNIVTATTDKYAKNFETFEKKIAECDVKRPEGTDLKPDEEFNKSIFSAQEEVAKLNARLSNRLVEVGAGNYLKDDQTQSLNAARNEKLAEIEQMKAEYIQKLDEDVKAGRIYAGYKEAREKQLKDPNYKYDNLPDYFPQSDDMTEEQKAERQRDIVKFALKQNSEALGFVETKPEATAEQAPEQAPKQAEKQADFIGTWFEPGQEITKDVLLGKINEIDARFAKPLNSDNWLKNREEYEKNLREKDRLDVVFRGCWNLLSKENKEKVFAKLKDVAVQAYHDMLCAEGKSKESKKLGEEILKNKDDLKIEEIRERAEKFLTKQERNSPAVSSYEYTSVDNIIGKGPEVWKEIVNNVPEESLREFALKADNKTFAMETMTLEEAEEPRYESQIDMLKKTVDEMTYLGQKEMTSERKEELKKMLDNVKGMTAEINAEYGSELADIRLKREESDYGMNRTRTLIAYENLKEQGFSTTNDGGSLILNGIKNEKVLYEKGMYEPRVRSLTPEAQQQFQKLKNFNFIIHPETQQKVKEIFAKFEEYGFDQANFEPEEQFKVYSMHKYARALEKFKECVASTDPADRAKTILAAGDLQVEYDKLKDLIQESGELFGVKEGGYYPGNLDCERNHALPPEFRNDLGGVSALNGLYILYRTVKERNISVDDVFKDPRAFMETITKESIDKMDVNKTIKGKSGAEAMFDVCRGSSTYDKTATYGINRSLETLAKMEKDPAVREYNMANEQAFSLSYGFAHKMTEQRDTAIDVMQTHLDRFLMVDKPCEDASLAGAPSMDYNTIELIPSQEFDEVEYLMNNREDPKTFTDRVMNEGCKFIEMHVNDLTAGKAGVLNELPIERGFYAMQRAAIKFLAVRQDIDKHSEAYHTLTQLAERGSDFIKEQIVKLKDEGKIHLREDPEDESKDALKLIQDSNIKNLKTSQSLKDFQKDMRSFGDNVLAADKTANRELKALKAEVERTQKAVNRNGSEIAEQQLKDAQVRYNEAIANRKEQLLQDFRKGDITEDYLNRRNEQLDNGKFNDVPKMFEADQLMSKNEYLEQYVKNFNANNTKGEDYNISLDELSKEEKNELYQRYVENANRAKERFIIEKYLISENKLPNLDQKTLKERIAAEDKRLEMMAKAYPEDAKEAVAKDKKIEEKAEEKAEEKVEEKTEEKGEEKTEEKVEENIIEEEELGEKISIDLDDEPVELNEDILNFSGPEKTLNKNELNV